MDVNGSRFWLVPLDRPPAGADPGLAFDPARGVLRLRSLRGGELPADAAAADAADRPAGTLDRHGTFAVLDATGTRVLAAGVGEGTVEVLRAPDGTAIQDLVLRADGLLVAALDDGRLALAGPEAREAEPPLPEAFLALDGFAPDRLAASPDGRIVALDRAHGRLAELTGTPLHRLAPRRFRAHVFRPREENPDPLRLEPLPLDLPEGHAPRAVAVVEERVAVLCWRDDPPGGPALLLVLDHGGERRFTLTDPPFPVDLAWEGRDRLLLLVAGWPGGRVAEAVAVDLAATDEAGRLRPAGERYPLPGWNQDARLLTGPVRPPHYLGHPDPNHSNSPSAPRPVVRLSLPSFAAAGTLRHTLDSGTTGFAWHRLYLEAALPPGTALMVRLTAVDRAEELGGPGHAHRFGVAATGGPEEAEARAPRGVWLPQASELPFHPGLLPCPSERDRAGLWSCLIQGGAGPERTLAGRFLAVAVELRGDRRSTPELASLRVWGPRFCYRDQYLPALYRDPAATAEPPSERERAAARLDFLGRFLALFEGVLTPVEDEVAGAFRLFRGRTAPAAALDWLASWLGILALPALPEARRRRLVEEATLLFRERGTARGLARALDIVTGDGVARGDLVLVEHFRLRRTLATILGARLEPLDDPLLPGRQQGGNSVVGRTLFLGIETEREFLALFRAEIAEGAEEEAAVAEFFDRFAHRATVLVHREVGEAELGLIRRTVAAEAPAHVETRVLAASRPLLVGLSALLAVDTYPRPRPPRRGVVLDETRFGAPAFLKDARSLDPRLEGGGP